VRNAGRQKAVRRVYGQGAIRHDGPGSQHREEQDEQHDEGDAPYGIGKERCTSSYPEWMWHHLINRT